MRNFAFNFSNTFKSVLLAVVISTVGCASASSGTKINQASVKKITIGVTTKEEMIQMFGSPLSQAYGPEGKLTMIWSYTYVEASAIGVTDMELQNLAVLFDQGEKVEKYNFIDDPNSNYGVRFGR